MQSSKPTQKLCLNPNFWGGPDKKKYEYISMNVFQWKNFIEFSVGIFVHAKDLNILGERERERERENDA